MVLLIALAAINDTAWSAAIATIISTVVGATVGYLTKRSSDQALVKVSETTTRGDIERDAFERAKGFYTDTIDRQAAELRDAEKEIADLRKRVGTCETTVSTLQREQLHYRRIAQRLARILYELRQDNPARVDPVLDETVIELLGDDPD